MCFLNFSDNKNHVGICVKNTNFNSVPDSLNQNLWGKSWDAALSDFGKYYCYQVNPANHRGTEEFTYFSEPQFSHPLHALTL